MYVYTYVCIFFMFAKNAKVIAIALEAFLCNNFLFISKSFHLVPQALKRAIGKQCRCRFFMAKIACKLMFYVNVCTLPAQQAMSAGTITKANANYKTNENW